MRRWILSGLHSPSVPSLRLDPWDPPVLGRPEEGREREVRLRAGEAETDIIKPGPQNLNGKNSAAFRPYKASWKRRGAPGGRGNRDRQLVE